MGSIARVKCYYCDLETFLKNHAAPVYGACLEGTSFYTQDFDAKGVLVMGSESHGISPKIEKLLNEEGYNIARRTVAKYREQLDIPVARLRKEL